MQKIQIPIGMFNKGAVIYIDFKYEEDSDKSKKRPAIVVDFNENSTRVIVLKVTTQGIRTEYDYPLVDAEMANLKQGSIVRCNHTLTLDNNYTCEKYGNLSRQDALAVQILYTKAVYDNAIVQV